MRSFLIALFSIFALSLTGCGDGIYSTAVTHDGTVIVVNKLTGSVQKIQGDLLVELRNPPAAVDANYRPKLADASIPKQPIKILGIAKYRDGNMLIKLEVRPIKDTLTPEEWSRWRKHIEECHGTDALLRLNFIDSDAFRVILQEAPLNEMTRVNDANGNLAALHSQISVALTRDNYDSIAGWAIGWSGWEQCSGISIEDMQKALEDAKKEGTTNKK